MLVWKRLGTIILLEDGWVNGWGSSNVPPKFETVRWWFMAVDV